MKRAGMLVVLLRGVRFWPSLRSMAVLSSRAHEWRSRARPPVLLSNQNRHATQANFGLA